MSPRLGGGLLLLSRHSGERIPLEFARTEVGAGEVESLVGRLEHGIPS